MANNVKESLNIFVFFMFVGPWGAIIAIHAAPWLKYGERGDEGWTVSLWQECHPDPNNETAVDFNGKPLKICTDLDRFAGPAFLEACRTMACVCIILYAAMWRCVQLYGLKIPITAPTLTDKLKGLAPFFFYFGIGCQLVISGTIYLINMNYYKVDQENDRERNNLTPDLGMYFAIVLGGLSVLNCIYLTYSCNSGLLNMIKLKLKLRLNTALQRGRQPRSNDDNSADGTGTDGASSSSNGNTQGQSNNVVARSRRLATSIVNPIKSCSRGARKITGNDSNANNAVAVDASSSSTTTTTTADAAAPCSVNIEMGNNPSTTTTTTTTTTNNASTTNNATTTTTSIASNSNSSNSSISVNISNNNNSQTTEFNTNTNTSNIIVVVNTNNNNNNNDNNGNNNTGIGATATRTRTTTTSELGNHDNNGSNGIENGICGIETDNNSNINMTRPGSVASISCLTVEILPVAMSVDSNSSEEGGESCNNNNNNSNSSSNTRSNNSNISSNNSSSRGNNSSSSNIEQQSSSVYNGFDNEEIVTGNGVTNAVTVTVTEEPPPPPYTATATVVNVNEIGNDGGCGGVGAMSVYDYDDDNYNDGEMNDSIGERHSMPPPSYEEATGNDLVVSGSNHATSNC